MRNQIFISYSHADSEYQLRLRKHLSIFERAGNIKYWSDTQLRTGDQWRKEIDENLQKTAVPILLISADFLASDFIRSNELPPLLEAWSQSGVFILPVIVKPCSFSHVKELSVFQAANDPERTISEMSRGEQERTWKNLAEIAYERLSEYQSAHPDTEKITEDITEDTTDDATKDATEDAVGPDEGLPAGSDVPELETPNPAQSLFVNLEDMIDFHINIADDDETEESSNGPSARQDQGPDLIYDYIRDLLEHPDGIQAYYVYTYEHIDILDFLPLAKDMLGKYDGYTPLLEQVKALFARNGWEGDGEIRLMWFPPFLKIGVEDTWGTLAWFVKQSNHGTSFIASPVPIPYLQLPHQRILIPDRSGHYTAQIAEIRRNLKPQYRCFKLCGLVDQVTSYVPGETHWLFYNAGEFPDPSVNDWIRFRVKKVSQLNNFWDIDNTRNIYVYSMEILPNS